LSGCGAALKGVIEARQRVERFLEPFQENDQYLQLLQKYQGLYAGKGLSQHCTYATQSLVDKTKYYICLTTVGHEERETGHNNR
jgi:hypothetical protein